MSLGKTEDTSRKTYEKACELQLNCFIGLHRVSQSLILYESFSYI